MHTIESRIGLLDADAMFPTNEYGVALPVPQSTIDWARTQVLLETGRNPSGLVCNTEVVDSDHPEWDKIRDNGLGLAAVVRFGTSMRTADTLYRINVRYEG